MQTLEKLLAGSELFQDERISSSAKLVFMKLKYLHENSEISDVSKREICLEDLSAVFTVTAASLYRLIMELRKNNYILFQSSLKERKYLILDPHDNSVMITIKRY